MPDLSGDSSIVRNMHEGEEEVMPKVDVIIPTRNTPAVLSLCLSHYWLNAHDEALVSSVSMFDNCSAALGMSVIQRNAQRMGASVFINEQNVGVWASVNRGLALSRSEYVLVLTSDVLLAPGSLRKLAGALNAEPKLMAVGPAVADGLQALPWLHEAVTEYELDVSTYNGACWMLRRSVLEQIGYFDSRFCVCFGDTDWMQRVRDAGWQHGVLRNARCIHLDKQSRKSDHSVDQDNEVEIRDAQRFHEKWKHRPDVLARHPIPDRAMYALQKDKYWSRELVVT